MRGILHERGGRIRWLLLDRPDLGAKVDPARLQKFVGAYAALGPTTFEDISAACRNIRIARVGTLGMIGATRFHFHALRRLQIDFGDLHDLVQLPVCPLEWLSVGADGRAAIAGSLSFPDRARGLRTLRLVNPSRATGDVPATCKQLPLLSALELLYDAATLCTPIDLLRSGSGAAVNVRHVRMRAEGWVEYEACLSLARLTPRAETVVIEFGPRSFDIVQDFVRALEVPTAWRSLRKLVITNPRAPSSALRALRRIGDLCRRRNVELQLIRSPR